MIVKRKKHKHAEVFSRLNGLYNGTIIKKYKHKEDKHPKGGKTYVLIDIKNKKIVYAGISKNPENRVKKHLIQMTTDTEHETRVRPSSNHLIDYLYYNQIKGETHIKMIILRRVKNKKAALLAEKSLIDIIQMNNKLGKGDGNAQ